jgi:septal ring factor EnvC (AmiA/AmiB activator)
MVRKQVAHSSGDQRLVIYWRHMNTKETTLDTILSTMERGFKAIADDISDLRNDMATKEDVRAIVRVELEPVETRLASIETELRSIRRDLDDLQGRYENVSGFRKEIDHALERIAAIEKQLRNDKRIVA